MKSSLLILVLLSGVYCLSPSNSASSRSVVRRDPARKSINLSPRRCRDIYCRVGLVRRDDDGDGDSDSDSGDGDGGGDDDGDDNDSGDDNDGDTDNSKPTSSITLASDKPSLTESSRATSTLWDDEGNGIVFPPTMNGAGHSLATTQTVSIEWDQNGNTVATTPTPTTYTLWDEDGNAVTIIPTTTTTINIPPTSEPTDLVSSEQPTNIPVPVDQTTLASEAPTEAPAPISGTDTNSRLSSTGNLEASNGQDTPSDTKNYPVIIGGSVGALAFVIGLGGFIGYRLVRTRRQARESRRCSKGYADLEEVAEIAAHSPGMNAPVPLQRHSLIPAAPPLITRQSYTSTRSVTPSELPSIMGSNGLLALPPGQPSRCSTQSSIGVRGSALEETLIIGFSDFDRMTPNLRRSSTTSSLCSSTSHEEALFATTALLPYMPQRPNEMLVQTGDEIVVTEEVGEEWFGGYNQSRDPETKGYFPRACVTGTTFL
ncbi:hypothetical protein K493DRAFT_356577 [Basidiobolus meristosporus CBS 931.73]|uniref:SH3 domain-containing protein n=1 Tax=Basidiobolus meristosporus CBS 931.73 TaxID=1314790 RepID=A0A1Y1XY49_9FUNG|nr:hypothetical protein K493DRAFT_356577 [Basidiobolus meristosporus CBS 931.73]|eukprot:ORX90673.1 hypothetical protein K493DRAFT_356577 [Basidiobolus meristosporus CBS 931.73]